MPESTPDHLQFFIHPRKGCFRLVEKAVHDASRELSLVPLVVVHLQDLIKRGLVHRVAKFGVSLDGKQRLAEINGRFLVF